MNKYISRLQGFMGLKPRYTLLSAFEYYAQAERYSNPHPGPFRDPVKTEVDLLTSIFPPVFPNWKVYVETFDRIEDPTHGPLILFEIQYWRSSYESFENADDFAGVYGVLKDDGTYAGWFCGRVGGNYIPMKSYGGVRDLELFFSEEARDLTSPRFSAQYLSSRKEMKKNWLRAFSERYAKMYAHLGPKGITHKSRYHEHQARYSR